MSIDLHIHTVHSDGTYTPSEIIHLAKKLGLLAVSITDHDTVSGTDEALETARKLCVEAISGIELSVRYDDTFIHLLGYFIDHESVQLQQKLLQLQVARKDRNLKIIQKLNALGIDISLDYVEKLSAIGQTGRPHIAQALRKKNVVKSINEAFEKYLKKGAAAYVSRFIYNADEAIDMLKNSGGLAVLAHPSQIDPTLETIPKLIERLVEIGLDGIEVYYPTHSGKMRKKLKNIAEKYQLIVTGGSDYHGTIRPGTSLAGGIHVDVPDEVLIKFKERLVA